jgi:hypothetical protein
MFLVDCFVSFNQELKDANSKTKQSTKSIKMPTPKQNNQPGANRHQLQNKIIN